MMLSRPNPIGVNFLGGIFVVGSLTLVAAAGCGGSGQPSQNVATAASRPPGARAATHAGILGCTQRITLAGTPAIRFCGPATAVASVGGRSRRVAGGSCVTEAGRFAVNVGTADPGAVAHPPDWLNVTTLGKPVAGAQDASVSVSLAGHRYAIVDGTITLAPGLKSGNFTGRTGPNPYFHANVKVTGSFTC
jgi:hypothetical protein